MKITLRGIRTGILTIILIVVADYTYHQRMSSREWDTSLEMIIYPINASGSSTVAEYIDSLSSEKFASIEEFFEKQGKIFNLEAMPPVTVQLGEQMDSIPPERPRSGNIISTILWTLKLRLWAYRNTPANDSVSTVVRMYVLYYDLKYNTPLPHSSGLQKGLLGVVHAFAAKTQAKQNKVIIAHEFLHTVGATDKYDPSTNLPSVPDGLANPYQKPLYPQKKAELMAGRLMVSASQSRIPYSLKECIVGSKTAQEVGWYDGGSTES